MTGNMHGCSRRDNGCASNESCLKVLEQVRDVQQEDGCSSECFASVETRSIDLNDELVTATGQCVTVRVCHSMLLGVCVCVSWRMNNRREIFEKLLTTAYCHRCSYRLRIFRNF